MFKTHCKHPQTGEVAMATGFKLRNGWIPCEADGSAESDTVKQTAEKKAIAKRAPKAPKLEVKDHVSDAPVVVQPVTADELFAGD